MAYAVIAKWTAKPDEVEEVERCLAAIVPLAARRARQHAVPAHRDPEDLTSVRIYEQYADEAATRRTSTAPHFKEIGSAMRSRASRRVSGSSW